MVFLVDLENPNISGVDLAMEHLTVLIVLAKSAFTFRNSQSGIGVETIFLTLINDLVVDGRTRLAGRALDGISFDHCLVAIQLIHN